MKIEQMPVKDLKPYERNAKKHDETQVKNVMESIWRNKQWLKRKII